jgi:hypothetical protein
MMSFSSTPTFIRQEPDTPMSEFALRVLVEFPDGETHIIGTATIIGGYLAITARHVLDDIISRFGSTQTSGLNSEISHYAVRLYQILPGPEYVVWDVSSAWPCVDTDIALLHLGLFKYSGPVAPSSWRLLGIKVVPPKAGTAVVGFGYHSSTVLVTHNDDGYHLDIDDEPTSTTGKVEEILPTGNPSGRFTFPCYRVNARFDGGMSGGPVIDENGFICGIVSGTFGHVEGEHTSYVATLWPILRTLISSNRAGPYPRDVKYPVIDLALNGLIHAEGLSELDPSLFPGRTLPR